MNSVLIPFHQQQHCMDHGAHRASSGGLLSQCKRFAQRIRHHHADDRCCALLQDMRQCQKLPRNSRMLLTSSTGSCDVRSTSMRGVMRMSDKRPGDKRFSIPNAGRGSLLTLPTSAAVAGAAAARPLTAGADAPGEAAEQACLRGDAGASQPASVRSGASGVRPRHPSARTAAAHYRAEECVGHKQMHQSSLSATTTKCI